MVLVFVLLRLFARQCGLVEQRIFAARDQTWMSFDAGDQMVWVASNREPGEGPESGSQRVWIDLVGACETNDGYKLNT